MKVIKVSKCYCCGKFSKITDIYSIGLCSECLSDIKKATNIVNNLLRKEIPFGQREATIDRK